MKRIARDSSDYRPILLLFYEEEVIGEALFLGLAARFTAPDQSEKARLLSQMERRVADAVRPLLERHALFPRSDSELHAIGAAEASALRHLSWDAFLRKIEAEFPVFLEEFAALNRVAPATDRPALAAFDDHEIATIDFARRELAGDSDSKAPLTAFIERFGPGRP